MSKTIKNRNPGTRFCKESQEGVNLRQNYPFKFGVDETGSSGRECDLNYRGKDAQSEFETNGLVNFVRAKLNFEEQEKAEEIFHEQTLIFSLHLESSKLDIQALVPFNFDSA